MTSAARANLARLLVRPPDRADDPGPPAQREAPALSLDSSRTWACRAVIRALLRYGMTGGWVSDLTDAEIRSLEDCRGVSAPTVQNALRQAEGSGELARATPAELRAWLASIGRAELLEPMADRIRHAKRLIVDLVELSGRIDAPNKIEQAPHKAEVAPTQLEDAPTQPEGPPRVRPRFESEEFEEREMSSPPLTPPDPEEVARLEAIRSDPKRSLLDRCMATYELEQLGALELPPLTPDYTPRLPAYDSPAEPADANPSSGRSRAAAGFLQAVRGIVASTTGPDPSGAIGRLHHFLREHLPREGQGPEGVGSPGEWRGCLAAFCASENGRVRLVELVERAARVGDEPYRYLWACLRNEPLGAQKPTPAPTRQSAAGVGQDLKQPTLVNCTRRVNP